MIERSHFGRVEDFFTPEGSADPPPPAEEDAAVERIDDN